MIRRKDFVFDVLQYLVRTRRDHCALRVLTPPWLDLRSRFPYSRHLSFPTPPAVVISLFTKILGRRNKLNDEYLHAEHIFIHEQKPFMFKPLMEMRSKKTFQLCHIVLKGIFNTFRNFWLTTFSKKRLLTQVS